MAAQTTGLVCDIINNHASLIDTALSDAEITSNGVLTLTRTDGSTFTNNIPYFQDFVISGIQLSLGVASGFYNNLSYTAGTYQINAVVYTLASSGTIIMNNGHATLPRIDIVYLDTGGNINYLVGTASSNPAAPTAPAGTLLIAEIGVDPLASATSNGYTLTNVNILVNMVNSGSVPGQMLIWNSTSSKWVPTNTIRQFTSTQVMINAATPGPNAVFSIGGGGLQLDNISALGTGYGNLLYAVAGDLYWAGVQLNTSSALPTGTVNNSVLIWDGSAWVENTNFIISDDSDNLGVGTNFSFGTGSQNTVFGIDSLDSVTVGVRNNVFGYQSATSLTSATDTVIFGTNSGTSITSGSGNLIFGNNTGTAITSGISNILIGNTTGQTIFTGNYNVFIGTVGGGLTTGSRNINLGQRNGFQNVSSSICIGTESSVTGSNRLVIGGNPALSAQINTMYFGAGESTPDSFTAVWQLSERTGSNAAGGHLYVRPQRSTGTGTSGSIIFQTSDSSGSSSSTANTWVSKLAIGENQVHINAGQIIKFTTAATTFTASNKQYVYLLDSTSSAFVVTLPTTGITAGTIWIFKDSGGSADVNSITLDPAGSATIDGSSSYTLNAKYEAVKVMFDGTNYHIIL